jgi:hypothetical protein
MGIIDPDFQRTLDSINKRIDKLPTKTTLAILVIGLFTVLFLGLVLTFIFVGSP